MIQWDNINTVLLDMDGTLLDLHFDNHFWQEHVPLRYSEKHSMDVDSAKEEIYPRFKAAEGTMDWYCLDYWSKQLDLNVAQLKLEVDHLIAIHPHVVEFLDAVRNSGRSLILVTNAHIDSLSLKMEKTSLQRHFDQLICAHDYGMPKEDPQFWNALKQQVNYDPKTTLLVDDSLPVLKSARRYGIQYLLAVLQPDSKSPEKDVEDFTAIRSFADIMPA